MQIGAWIPTKDKKRGASWSMDTDQRHGKEVQVGAWIPTNDKEKRCKLEHGYQPTTRKRAEPSPKRMFVLIAVSGPVREHVPPSHI
jgi:hypothetical protein